jgi:hypothetical protein
MPLYYLSAPPLLFHLSVKPSETMQEIHLLPHTPNNHHETRESDAKKQPRVA